MTEQTPRSPAEVAGIIDYTRLDAAATRANLRQLCEEAAAYRFATVCVNPAWVAECAGWLARSTVGVGTVVGFPLGASVPAVKAFEARRAIADGAAEIDAVMNIGALRSGDLSRVRRDMDAVVSACREGGALAKIILETSLLTDAEKQTACRLAEDAGAEFVKTSTGFGPGGATPADVALLRRAVGTRLGVKASGGIRTLNDLRALVAAGASRIGTSAGVAIVLEARERASG